MATTQQIVFMNQASKPREEREIIGQFLTPSATAELLAESFAEIQEGQQIRLLDPGAGAGALTVAFVKRALRFKPSSIHVTAVESDETILPHLCQTMHYVSQVAESAGVLFQFAIHHNDFLALVIGTEDLFAEKKLEPTFTHAILNPPYKKISTDGEERKLLSRIGIEVSNIYAGFVALSLKLLVDGGELVAITPRSFCNGPYFKAFRHFLLQESTFRKFHVVASRTKAFSEDAVLQENVIFALQKGQAANASIDVCTSEQATFEQEVCNRVPYDLVVHPKDKEEVLYLPVDAESVECMRSMSALPCTLEDLALTVSTGPVVDFRAKHLLRKDIVDGAVPLLYPTHFTSTGIDWPKNGKKPNAILVSPELMPFLVPAGTYVIVKRFSSKEERKRIVARVLKGTQFQYEFIGLENHLNFFHQHKAELDLALAFGLAAYLNWTMVDKFFRLFNGHTQVNAADLRLLRYPTTLILRRIGEQIEAENDPWRQDLVDAVVAASV